GKSPKPPPRQPGIASDYLQPYDDIFIAMLSEGRVLAFNGHVDLGTGVRTALAQVVAEELDVDVDRIDMILGHTSATPNQRPIIASATLQISAVPLRQAAAQARHHLVAKAAAQWGVAAESLVVSQGVIGAPDGRSATYWSLLKGEQIRLEHDAQTPIKPASRYTLIGKSIPRVDIPATATAQLALVHDVRVPGIWH